MDSLPGSRKLKVLEYDGLEVQVRDESLSLLQKCRVSNRATMQFAVDSKSIDLHYRDPFICLTLKSIWIQTASAVSTLLEIADLLCINPLHRCTDEIQLLVERKSTKRDVERVNRCCLLARRSICCTPMLKLECFVVARRLVLPP